MSDGWGNPVIGGADTLLRRAIRSPDYLAGVSGWSVNRDGTAEFNDASFRGSVVIDNATEAILVYDGPPALGNLIFALSNTQGLDDFGNGYGAGVTLPAETGSAKSGVLRWKQPGGNTGTSIGEIIAFTDSADPRVEIWARNAARLLFQYAAGSAGLQFGAGPTGRYYAESQFFGPQNFATGGGLKNLSLVESVYVHGNDYAVGGFDITNLTGLWTAPESGLFHCSLVIAWNPEWAPATAPMAELRLGVLNNLRGQLWSTSNMSGNGRGIMTVDIDAIKGDAYRAQVFHSMGATATLANQMAGGLQASRWTMRRYL